LEPTAQGPAPLRVLVADDDRETANVLAAILRDEGHEVHVALRGDEVSDIDRLMRPDVVILGSASGAGRWHRCSSPFRAPGRTSPTGASPSWSTRSGDARASLAGPVPITQFFATARGARLEHALGAAAARGSA